MIGTATCALVALIGAGAFWVALGFGWGAGPRIGSAYLPLLLSGLLVISGLWGTLQSLKTANDQSAMAPDWRAFGAVMGAVILFMATIESIGLIPATLICMVVAYLGQIERRYGSMLLYASFFAGTVWLVFSVGLGMPVPAFGS